MILLAYSVLAKPQYAYAPVVRLVLAQLWPHLVLDCSDCIDFSIIILDNCPRRVSVIITMAPYSRPRLQVWLHRHRQPRPWHPLAQLPRPRLQHQPLLATSTSAQGLPPRLSSHQLPLQSKHPYRDIDHDAPAPTAGGVSLLGLLRFISSLTVHVVHVVHDASATTARAGGVGGVLEICSARTCVVV
jgi:hypothetical protein